MVFTIIASSPATAEDLYTMAISLEKSKPHKSRSLFEQAAKMGHMKACTALGISYVMGCDSLEVDYDQGVYWLDKAAKRGHVQALYTLGMCYHRGMGVNQDEEKAVRLYILAAKSGDVAAACALGICYEEGVGVVHNRSQAIKWLGRAAFGGSAEAQYTFALFYIQGKGVRQNDGIAKSLMERAAAQQHEDAIRELVYLKAFGDWDESIKVPYDTDTDTCSRYGNYCNCGRNHAFGCERDAGYGYDNDEDYW